MNDPGRLEESRAHRILWFLEELKIPYKLQSFKLDSDKLSPKTLKIYPSIWKVTDFLAESGFIAEHLCGHFSGVPLIPKWFADAGKDAGVGSEAQGWPWYRYYMHYTEGSLVPTLVMKVVASMLRTAPPVFIRGLFSFVASKIETNFLDRNFVDHFDLLENQLRSALGGGPFLTGQKLTIADILMSYPVVESMTRVVGVQKGVKAGRYPLLSAYAARLQEYEGYERASAKIITIDGYFKACLENHLQWNPYILAKGEIASRDAGAGPQ
ncbi:hypothetical protein BDW68DRAFT_192551 [Aspergillus falconensis]